MRFQDDINYQKFLASPYAAHLNFKTFENFFDCKISGEKEINGKTIFKLKKMNPWRRTYQQQMLLWMWQNKQKEQEKLNREESENRRQDSSILKKEEVETPLLNQNGQGANKRDEEVSKDMILAEGYEKSLFKSNSLR